MVCSPYVSEFTFCLHVFNCGLHTFELVEHTDPVKAILGMRCLRFCIFQYNSTEFALGCILGSCYGSSLSPVVIFCQQGRNLHAQKKKEILCHDIKWSTKDICNLNLHRQTLMHSGWNVVWHRDYWYLLLHARSVSHWSAQGATGRSCALCCCCV